MTSYEQRRDYNQGTLNENDVHPDPFEQFRIWFSHAESSQRIDEPSAMTLATATSNGAPSARIVLLRNLDTGFVFYTNYESRKGRELTENPLAALVFYWGPLEHQIRIEGTVTRVGAAESDTYFASRPFKSRLGAIASPQSTAIDGRQPLEDTMTQLEARYDEASIIERPQNWGGFRLIPLSFEFWQGRRSRLHDRILYTRPSVDADWTIGRLAP